MLKLKDANTLNGKMNAGIGKGSIYIPSYWELVADNTDDQIIYAETVNFLLLWKHNGSKNNFKLA